MGAKRTRSIADDAVAQARPYRRPDQRRHVAVQFAGFAKDRVKDESVGCRIQPAGLDDFLFEPSLKFGFRHESGCEAEVGCGGGRDGLAARNEVQGPTISDPACESATAQNETEARARKAERSIGNGNSAIAGREQIGPGTHNASCPDRDRRNGKGPDAGEELLDTNKAAQQFAFSRVGGVAEIEARAEIPAFAAQDENTVTFSFEGIEGCMKRLHQIGRKAVPGGWPVDDECLNISITADLQLIVHGWR